MLRSMDKAPKCLFKEKKRKQKQKKENEKKAETTPWGTMPSATVVVQFYSWFNFYFPLFLCMVMHDDEYDTKGNKN